MEFLKKAKRRCSDFFKPKKPFKFGGMKIDPKYFAVDPPQDRSPWKRMTRGSFSQADIPSHFYNSQCTTMAVTALMYSNLKPINTWTKQDLDNILIQGNQNHAKYRQDFRFSNDNDGRISLDDLPSTFPINFQSKKSLCMKTADFQGPVSSLNPASDEQLLIYYPALVDVIQSHLKADRPIVATISEFTVLFFKFGSDIWLFDSHRNDENGKYNVTTGKAFVAPFSSIKQLEQYLLKRYTLDSMYNAYSFKIWLPEEYSSNQHEIIRRLERTLLRRSTQNNNDEMTFDLSDTDPDKMLWKNWNNLRKERHQGFF